jgi:auxin responsive GH3 family protein
MCYFEFIHLGENGTWLVNKDEEGEVPNDKLVNLVNVRLGSYYELVVTTFAGKKHLLIGFAFPIFSVCKVI